MKREELRKVVITSQDYYSVKIDETGYFHLWTTVGNREDGLVTLGIIELQSGRCMKMHVGDFKFTDNE